MWSIQRTAAVMVVALTAPAGLSSAGAAEPTLKLATEQFMIDSADPGIRLYVRNKRPEDLLQFTSEKFMARRSLPRRLLIFSSKDCPGWTT